MRRFLIGWGLWVGLAAGQCMAADDAPLVTLGQPVAVSLGKPIAASAAKSVAPVASLAAPRPIALDVQPASLTRIVRAQSADAQPSGTPSQPSNPTVGQPPEVLHTPRAAEPTVPVTPPVTPPATPPMVTTGPLTTPPLMTGPISTGPVLSHVPMDGGFVAAAPIAGDCCSPSVGPMVSGACDTGCAVTPGHSASDGRDFWFNAEGLAWWVRGGDRIPVLVTASPPSSMGIIGRPGVSALLGGDGSYNPRFQPGFRVSGGLWFDECHTRGLDASFFLLPQQESTFSINSSQAPGQALSRPFFNTNPAVRMALLPPQNGQPGLLVTIGPGETAEMFSQPSLFVGQLDARFRTEFLGADINYRRNLINDCGRRCDLLLGYRYLRLSDDLEISESVLGILPGVNAGSAGFVYDSFRTKNDFSGFQIGWASHRNLPGRFTLDCTAKVAFGNVRQQIDIGGSTIAVSPNLPISSSVGGALAVPGNIGVFERNRFAVVPEASVNVGYQLSDHVKLFVGYNFLLISNVVRSGDQIDRNIDGARIPFFYPTPLPPLASPVAPTVPFRDTTFWAQGINFGINLTW